MPIALTMTPKMVEEVIQEWEAAHPGCKAERDLSGEEFSRLYMQKLKATVQVVDEPSSTEH